MLVLSRSRNEAITVKHNGEVLRIVIVTSKGNRVRVGLDGPDSFEIARDELLDNAGPPLAAAMARRKAKP